MMFIELLAPRGILNEEQRRYLSERLVTELMRADGVSADIIERGRAMTWLVIHEPDTWTIGGRPGDPSEAPRYLVRMSVPGGHLNDSMRAEVIRRITRVLSEVDDDPQRLYQEPNAWVHIVELPDGNIGAFGQIVSLADIIKLIVDPGYKGARAAIPTDESVPDTAIDPICGMTVALTDTAITLEHNGTTYAFCNPGCHDIFVAQQRAATPK